MRAWHTRRTFSATCRGHFVTESFSVHSRQSKAGDLARASGARFVFLAERPAAARELCGDSRLPTLCQFDPLHRYFEQEADGSLLFSAAGSVPLLRYKILDRGGVIGHAPMIAFLEHHGFSPKAAGARELPFVYVFGRSSLAVSFYRANVYPENIAPALEQRSCASLVTGKFMLQVVHDAAGRGARRLDSRHSAATQQCEAPVHARRVAHIHRDAGARIPRARSLLQWGSSTPDAFISTRLQRGGLISMMSATLLRH